MEYNFLFNLRSVPLSPNMIILFVKNNPHRGVVLSFANTDFVSIKLSLKKKTCQRNKILIQITTRLIIKLFLNIKNQTGLLYINN